MRSRPPRVRRSASRCAGPIARRRSARRPHFVSPSTMSVVVEVNPDGASPGPVTFANNPGDRGRNVDRRDRRARRRGRVRHLALRRAANAGRDDRGRQRARARPRRADDRREHAQHAERDGDRYGRERAHRAAAESVERRSRSPANPAAYELVGRAPATFTVAPLDAGGNVIVQPDAPVTIALAPNARVRRASSTVTPVSGTTDRFTVQAVAPNDDDVSDVARRDRDRRERRARDVVRDRRRYERRLRRVRERRRAGGRALRRARRRLCAPVRRVRGAREPGRARVRSRRPRDLRRRRRRSAKCSRSTRTVRAVAAFAAPPVAGRQRRRVRCAQRQRLRVRQRRRDGVRAERRTAARLGAAVVCRARTRRASRSSPRRRTARSNRIVVGNRVGNAEACDLHGERRSLGSQPLAAAPIAIAYAPPIGPRQLAADDGADLRHERERHRGARPLRRRRHRGGGRGRAVRHHRRSEPRHAARRRALRQRRHDLSRRPERDRRDAFVRDARRARPHPTPRSLRCLLGSARRCCSRSRSARSRAPATHVRPRRTASVPLLPVPHRVAFMGYLRDGSTATVYADGGVTIAPPRAAPRRRRSAAASPRRLAGSCPDPQRTSRSAATAPLEGDVPPATRRQILFDLEHPPQRYVPERVLVAFAPSVTMARDSDALAPAAARSLRTAVLAKRRDVSPHPFTNDQRTNTALMSLGVDRADRLFGHVDRGIAELAAHARGSARAPSARRVRQHLRAARRRRVRRRRRAPPARAARRHVRGAGSRRELDDRRAPAGLRRHAARDRGLPPLRRRRSAVRCARRRPPRRCRRTPRSRSNLQALLNAPGVDAVAAFDEIGARFNQLPGAGEIITNVGLGDADDASAGANPNDPCNAVVASRRADDAHGRRSALPRLAVAAADPGVGVGRERRTCRRPPRCATSIRCSARSASTSR